MRFSKEHLPPVVLQESADAPGASPQSQTQYAWTAKDRSICIRFHFRVIRGLAAERTNAAADREVKAGGVLLGSVAGELTPVVVVEAFEPAGHNETMQLLFDRWRRAPERRIYAVGSYRLGGFLEPSAPGWSAGTLSDPRVDVAIEGLVPDGLAASISWCPDAEGLPQRDRLVFPESQSLPSGSLPPSAGAASAVHMTSHSDRGGDAGQRADHTWNRKSLTLVIGGIVVLASVAAIAFKAKNVRPSPPPTELSAPRSTETSVLGLSVQRAGGSLIVKWDPEVVTNSTGGILTIRVHDSRRDWVLDRDQLRTGRVFYSVDADDIIFRLEVFDDLKRSRLETLRVLTQPNIEAVWAPPRVDTPPRRERSEPATEPAAARIQTKPFVAPRSVPAKTGPTVPEADLPPATMSIPPVAEVRLPSPQISLARPPAQLSSVAETVPNSGGDAATAVTPPVPVSRPAPTLPPNLKALIQTRVSVTVTVMVDALGKVTAAEGTVEAPASPGALSEFAKRAAVDAARRWRFEPAQVNGHAVPGSCVIHFEFGPAITGSETRVR